MDTRARLAAHYPVFALEVRTPRLTLRYPDDDDLVALAELGAQGVHDEEAMPFTVPWTSVPSPFQQRNTLEFFWGLRSSAQTNDWSVTFITVVEGEIVGSQGLMGRHWRVARTFETGSWLGLAHHGRGIGKEMRAAALQLGFAGFGAMRATTAAFADNPGSLGVTRSLGYRPNGDEIVTRGEEAATLLHFCMDRSDWEPTQRDDIEIVGAEPVVEMFGTARPPGSPATP